MPKFTGARFIAETVHGYGLTHVFYMPYIMPEAILEMDKLGVTAIQSHGEKAAAYMADAYARVRRGPSLVMAQSVGAANLAAGLQDAYLACSPVIALTGRERQHHLQRNSYQEVDHKPFAAVTKYSAYVPAAETLPVYLRQAFRSAVSGTPGPTHLDLEGIAGLTISDGELDAEVVVEQQFTQVPAFRPVADAALIDQALQLLNGASRPVIVAGGGVTASDAREELIGLAEKLSIPVATALNAKAMFPADHPLAIGTPGNYSRECTNRILCKADMVFFIGSHTGGQLTHDFRIPPQGTRAIQLDINGEEIGRNYTVEVGLQGDAKASLAAMIKAASPGPDRADWLTEVQGMVARWKDSVEEHWNSDWSPLRPERICRELSEHLPSDAIVVSDTGHSGVWTGTMLDLKHPTQSFIRCAGSLGWGLPAALGAKCAAPDRPVLCFTGDGGIWYHISELETAMKENLHVVILVNNNHSLNQEKNGVESYEGQSEATDKQWLFPDADFAAIARSMGAEGLTVDKPADLPGALDKAFSASGPVLVDVKSHVDAIAPIAWLP
ncbi:MAG: thiamine pyrophosphate-binding protein [Alphaproteobacteria bacterium]